MCHLFVLIGTPTVQTKLIDIAGHVINAQAVWRKAANLKRVAG